MSDENREIVEQANALLMDGKTEEFTLLCTEDVEWTLLGDSPTKINGRDGIIKFMASTSPSDSEVPKFTVLNILAEGDTVISNGEMSMKGNDGKLVPYAYCDIYTFKDGKIAKFLTFMNKTQAEPEKQSTAKA